MTGPEGGFYSTEDADSEGVEGKYYVWSPAEVADLLGSEKAKTFCYVYDITEQGNWEDHNILNLPRTVDQASQLLGRDSHELAHELAAGRASFCWPQEPGGCRRPRIRRSWFRGTA